MHYHCVEMSIYEIGFFKTSATAHDFTRLDILHSCLKSVQAFFSDFLSQPVSVVSNLSLFTFTQLANAVVILHKLCTFEHPDWDLDYMRATLDFGDVVGQVITWFESSKEFERYWIGGLDSSDVASRTARKMRRIKAWYDQKMSQKMSVNSSVPELSSTMPDTDADEPMNGGFEFLNGAWLEDLVSLGPWNYQTPLN